MLKIIVAHGLQYSDVDNTWNIQKRIIFLHFSKYLGTINAARINIDDLVTFHTR